MNHNTKAADAVISRARAALLILEDADRAGLPLPYNTTTLDYADHVRFMFRSLADLAAWSLWLEEPITETKHGDDVHHYVTGEALDHPVECIRVELAPETDA